MEYLELIGVGAFAVSGAMAAIDRQADVFGVLFLAVVTALGGGVLRDMLLGELPPRMFTSYECILTAVVCGSLVFLDALVRRERYKQVKDKIDGVVNIFDALGLAVFTVSGMSVSAQSCGMDNPVLLTVMGMTTGVGGGMLRDVLIGRMPRVLCKRIYAVASLAGAILLYLLLRFGVGSMLSSIIAASLIFGLRILATRYKWSLPQAKL